MTVTVTEEELQRIVATAVKVALNEILGPEASNGSLQPREKVAVQPFSATELDNAMRLMESNRGKGQG